MFYNLTHGVSYRELTSDTQIGIEERASHRKKTDSYSCNTVSLENRAIQGSFANCNISVDLDLFNEGIIEYI